jgi:hypothetical protein
MRILIFGATGGTGRELVLQALQKGYDVSAFVRTPSKLTIQTSRLRIVQGDIQRVESIHSAIPGHDGVLSALGTRSLGPTTLLSDAAREIVRTMEAHGVRHILRAIDYHLGQPVLTPDSQGQPPVSQARDSSSSLTPSGLGLMLSVDPSSAWPASATPDRLLLLERAQLPRAHTLDCVVPDQSVAHPRDSLPHITRHRSQTRYGSAALAFNHQPNRSLSVQRRRVSSGTCLSFDRSSLLKSALTMASPQR